MENALQHRVKTGLLSGIAAIAMFLILLVASPQHASATESPYCGGWLGSQATCYGAKRTFNAVYGSGQQHAVCVGSSQGGNVTCSGGPGQGTYDALGGWVTSSPWIQNKGFSSNLVQGIAFTP